jgi:hypothetical protein
MSARGDTAIASVRRNARTQRPAVTDSRFWQGVFLFLASRWAGTCRLGVAQSNPIVTNPAAAVRVEGATARLSARPAGQLERAAPRSRGVSSMTNRTGMLSVTAKSFQKNQGGTE